MTAPDETVKTEADATKQNHFQQFKHDQEEQARRSFLRERSPTLYARLAILENLVALQETRGGEFPPKVVFIHMPDYILNVRRVGRVDIYSLVAAVEVYKHSDIVPGIVWLPLDHIWWAGTTDAPVDGSHVSLRHQEDATPKNPGEYEELRHQLAELPKRTT